MVPVRRSAALKCTIVLEIDKWVEAGQADGCARVAYTIGDSAPVAEIVSRLAAGSGPYVLAIDIGTSSTRAMLFDVGGTAVPHSEVQAGYEFDVDASGAVTIGADRLFATALEVLDAALGRTGARPGQIHGVGVSCFWHSLLALDRDGEPLTPVLSWADTRSAPDAAALARDLDEEETHARTGCVLHASYWPAKLRWLERTAPDRFRRIGHLGGYAEYLSLRLCGQYAASISMASGTGLFDQHRADWDAPLVETLRIDRATLPRLVDRDDTTSRLASQYAGRWPALAGIPWFPAVGDGAASNVGSGCVDTRRMALSVGTSGVMRVIVPAGQVTIPPRLWCYRLDRSRLVLGGALSNAGNGVAWLGDTLALPADADQQLAAMAPGAHGLTMLPYFAGERTPEWNPLLRGAVTGLGLHSTSIDILRAMMEAVACRFALVHDLLRPLVASPYEIIGSGGGLEHWTAWRQIIADALGHPVALARELEASARGAALLALDALGAGPGIDDIDTPIAEVLQPDGQAPAAYRAVRERVEWLTALLRP